MADQNPAPTKVPNSVAGMTNSPANERPESLIPNVRITERRDVHSMLQLDDSTVDENRHYRFVRRDSMAMTKAKLKGYSLELTREGGPRLLGEVNEDAADGTISVGDVVLMSCPKELFQQGRDEIDRQNEAMLSQPADEAVQKIKEAGNRKGGQAFSVITNKE
jgi:hypothetical protein